MCVQCILGYMSKIKILILAAVIPLLVAGGVFFYFYKYDGQTKNTESKKDKYLEFSAEIYDKIKGNYWEKISDEELAGLFKLAVEKVKTSPAGAEPKDKVTVLAMLEQSINGLNDNQRVEFIAKVADLVLANLKPFGRSRLYTAKQEKELEENVKNIDTKIDLYAALDLAQGATENQIEENYRKKSEQLKKDSSPKASEELALINRAYEALSQPERRKEYDETKIEPTVTYKLLTPDIFYIKLGKFSPQSFEELKKAADSIDPKKTNGPTALIFDLRDNIGGAIDILPYFLGPFIGPNQYAYEFYHQGEQTPFKTKIGWFESLIRYKKVVVLINEKSQSSAEVMTATLKKYNVGVVIGAPTKGWGTVEMVYALDNQIDESQKFSMFLVHSVTLRDDGQPIEGRGVDPVIDIKNKDWPKQLMAYFNYPSLVETVKKLVE